MSRRFIYSWSAQHTGTWFLLNTMGYVGSDIHIVSETEFIEPSPAQSEATWRTRPIEDVCDARKINGTIIIHSHADRVIVSQRFDIMRRAFTDKIVGLEDVKPVAVPVRDPLLSMITREVRTPIDRFGLFMPPTIEQVRCYNDGANYFDHCHIVNGLLGLSHLDASFFPVDLPLSDEQRRDQIRGLLTHMGLPHTEAAVKRSWAPDNTTTHDPVKREHPAKVAYKRRDVQFFQRTMPMEWGALKGAQSRLQPFMERLGYKDLMWFD